MTIIFKNKLKIILNMVYNAIVEQKIYDLIEKASKSSLLDGALILQQTLKYLNQEFRVSHFGDLLRHDVERIQVRNQFYRGIIRAYEGLIKKSIETNPLKEKNEILTGRVEELLSEIDDFKETQQEFKRI